MMDNRAGKCTPQRAGEGGSLSPKSPICKHLTPKNREFRPEPCCFRAPIPGYLRPALVNCLGNSTYQPAFMLTSGRFHARLRWIDSGVVPMRLLIPQGGNSHLVSWPQARRASAKGVLAWLINLCCCRILPSAHSYLRAVLHPPAARSGWKRIPATISPN